MRIDPLKTLRETEQLILQSKGTEERALKKAYDKVLRLRSQLLSLLFDLSEFGQTETENVLRQNVSGTTKNGTVTLTIPEPLPAVKELTAAVEEHWVDQIRFAISEGSRDGILHFDRAFVWIEVIAPRGTNNAKVWDVSNRAVNVILNNLKGVFFRDDDFEHMAFGITANWGGSGQTIIRICALEQVMRQMKFEEKTDSP